MVQTGTAADAQKTWHAQAAADVAAELDTDVASGLTSIEAAARLRRVGPNELPKEAAPSRWAVAAGQWRDPMNVLLTVIGVVSFVAGQVETGLLVAGLVLLNVVLGTRQEMAARASVDALESLNVPSARVRRDGRVAEVQSTDLVPGDVLVLEAGDIVPADARLVTSAGLEAMESALTGESLPVEKGAGEALDPDAARAPADRHDRDPHPRERRAGPRGPPRFPSEGMTRAGAGRQL